MSDAGFQTALIAQCALLAFGWAAGLWGVLRPQRASSVASVLHAIGAMVAAGISVATRGHFEAAVRQQLFLDHPQAGWWFERKENLLFAAAALACALACTTLLEVRASMRPDHPLRNAVGTIRKTSVTTATVALAVTCISLALTSH